MHLTLIYNVQLASMAQTTNNVWANMAAFAPNFVEDHVLAACLWGAFYIAECASYLADMDRAGGQFMTAFAAIPRMMMPIKLTAVKVLWLRSRFYQAPEARSHVAITTGVFSRLRKSV